MMNASELISRAVDVAENYKTVYMWGVFGAPSDRAPDKAKDKPIPKLVYSCPSQALFRSLIGERYFAFDCVNLIKGILWGWDGDDSKTYGGASYASNNVPDVSADQMIALCDDVSTDFSGIPIGAALWTSGHIGLYIGDGLGVECTPRWKNGVQITAVGNIGKKSGYNTRIWRKWGYIPYVNYEEEDDEMLDLDRFKELLKEYRAELQDNDSSEYSEKAREWAVDNKLITGSGAENFMWEDILTREQFVTVLYRFATEVLGMT